VKFYKLEKNDYCFINWIMMVTVVQVYENIG